MTEVGFVRGQPWHIQGLNIRANRVQEFGGGNGGGYEGEGHALEGYGDSRSWGLQDGPRRGEGGSGTIRDVPGPNVMSEFKDIQAAGQFHIDSEYNPLFGALATDVERELEQKTQVVKAGRSLSVAESAAIGQQAALELIDSKKSQFIVTAPSIYRLYGQSPYYLMNVLPRRKIAEALNALQHDPHAVYNALGLFDDVYKSAMELKRLSLSLGILAGKLAELAAKRSAAESNGSLDDVARLELQDQRISIIGMERDVHAQQLPEFLQDELVAAAGSMNGLTLSQTLTHYKLTLDRLAASKTAQIQPAVATEPYRQNGLTINFTLNNPKINAPLSKPELEALNELVFLQRTTPLGTKWISYHDAVLKAESARHLTVASNAFTGLVERAQDAEQIKNALKFTVDFYKEVTEKFGERASVLAKELSASAKGKKIRNANEAMKAFNQHKGVLRKKFGVKDRKAIAKAIEALDKEVLAKNLARFSKGFGVAGLGIDALSLLAEAQKSMASGNWKPFFLKVESMLVGLAAGALLAMMFGTMLATPIGILGFGLMMAVTSSLIDDALVGKINDFVLGN